MDKIYLDNASTSFPKAPGVGAAVSRFIEETGCNINRGEYESAYNAAEMVLDTRERLCELLGFSQPRGVIFTVNVTAALNMVLWGFLQNGGHVLVSAMEHNAVMRPLTQLASRGVTFSRIPCDDKGRLLLHEAQNLLRSDTKALIMTHASNVCGTLLPAQEAGEFCKKNGLRFILDCAQTAGAIPVYADTWGVDALCFTGHKSLLGPQGIGGFCIRPEFAQRVEPVLCGGTGSFSDSESMPALLPDRYEAGTLNLPGICGLNAALHFLAEYGIDTIRKHEIALTSRLTSRLSALTGVHIAGVEDAQEKSAVVSIDCKGRDNAEIAFCLDNEYGIMTRCGLHCAPNAHKTLGTFPQGTVRFSVGYANTEHDIDMAVDALAHILKAEG